MVKTLEDLPKFTVHSMEADAEHVLLKGMFDRIDGVRVDGWDYLYSFGPPYLAAEVASFNSQSKRAGYRVFRKHASAKSVRPGSVLYWLYAYWKPEVVDAVLDLQYAWAPQIFVNQDAYSRRTDNWRVLSPVSQGAPGAEHAHVEGGWNHEHCDICNGHIDPGSEFYQRDYVFICHPCFERFVRTHDLSFLSY